MTIQLSTAVRNARLDAIEATIGTSAIVKIYSGTMPANCDAADAGTALVEFDLGSDWCADATSGSKSFANTPLAATAGDSGTAAFYRVYASDGSTCHMQGTVSIAGGGGDMTLDNVSINSGQSVSITSWVLNDANA